MSSQTNNYMLSEILEHGKHVERLAMLLFADFAPLHLLGVFWKSVLSQAALYHDIGWLKGGEGHHKHSARLLRSASIPMALEGQRPLVAFVARYHKGALPALRHRRFAALNEAEQNAVSALSAILRLADALDYTHTGCITCVQAKNVQACAAHIPITLLLTCKQANSPLCCRVEIDRVKEKSDAFSAYYKRRLMCLIEK